MNCKRVRELILTDYLDNCMSDNVRIEFDAHLAECAECNLFAHKVKDEVSKPFSSVQKEVPPEKVWHNLKEVIVEEGKQPVSNPFVELLGKLARARFFPRPAFAFATAMAIMLILAVFVARPLHNQAILDNYINDQIGFLDSLEEFSGESYDEIGTSIEKYLF
ncbi:MAG: zf-HC2 domain-containing protein [Candidatus Omnitrophota bacterium]